MAQSSPEDREASALAEQALRAESVAEPGMGTIIGQIDRIEWRRRELEEMGHEWD